MAEEIERMEVVSSVTGKTKLLGVIGNPLEHSISPQLHNTLSRYLGIDAVYVPFYVQNGQLKDTVKGLLAVNVFGFNITIPYKSDIICCIDKLSKEAALIGAVNTVKNINGKLYGYNTDASGFIRSFKEEMDMELKGKKVVIFGAGGAARAIAVGLAFEGVSQISIINRTILKASEIAEIINNNISPIAKYYGTIDSMATNVLKQGDIIINTTSLGMYPDIDKTPIKFPFKFSDNQVLYDIIYNPKKTRFIEEGERQGLKTVNGLGMLIYQGIQAYEIWMNIKVSDEIIKKLFNVFNTFFHI